MIKMDGISEFTNFRDEAHLKYEFIRPVLLGQITARDRALELQLHEKTLSKYLKHFRKNGYTGLLDQRHGPFKRTRELSQTQQAQLITLKLAYGGFSLRELATIVGQEYNRKIDYKTVFSVLKRYEALFTYSQNGDFCTSPEIVHFRIT
jgi:transposase